MTQPYPLPHEVASKVAALGINATDKQKELMTRLASEQANAAVEETSVKESLWEGYQWTKESSPDKQDAIEFFKQLDKAGCGTFIVGRHGNDSRIQWEFDVRLVARTFLGLERPHDLILGAPEFDSDSQKSPAIMNGPAVLRDSARPYLEVRERTSTANSPAEDRSLSPLPDNASRQSVGTDRLSTESYDHSFLLRPGLKITVSLPLNITKDEANRLAEFIRSVPF